MSIIPTVHLIHWYIWAWKTTFSKKLESELPAIRFTPDEWMISVFWKNPFPWDREKFEKFNDHVTTLLENIAFKWIANGVDVILDDGFRSRKRRNKMNERIKAAWAQAKWYFVKCPTEEMKNRTLERTKNPPKESFHIDENAIEELRQFFEPMGDDEEHEVVESSC